MVVVLTKDLLDFILGNIFKISFGQPGFIVHLCSFDLLPNLAK
jgi:hypothetical protein